MMLPLLSDTADSSEVLRRLSRQLQRGHPAHKDIQLLLTVLDDPLLRTVLQIKNSLDDLKVLVHKHPSILPRDFEIARDGTLDYRCDPDDVSNQNNNTTAAAAANNNNNNPSNNQMNAADSNNGPVSMMMMMSGSLAGHRVANRGQPLIQQVHSQLQQQRGEQQFHHGPGTAGGQHCLQSFSGLLDEGSSAMGGSERFVAIELEAAPPASDSHLHQQGTSTTGTAAAAGGLGLTVIPLAGEDGETHFYIKHIHPDGVAHRDGRLSEGDKVVAINGTRLSGLSHRDVVQLLQQYNNNNNISTNSGGGSLSTSDQQQHTTSFQQVTSSGDSLAATAAAANTSTNLVSLLVDTSQRLDQQKQAQLVLLQHLQQQQQQQQQQHLTSYNSDFNNCWTDGQGSGTGQLQSGEFVPEMVLNTEWAQVEAIELVNDGSGLGFGIIGGRSTGVVVKTILPGGVADKDGRLLSGDHILQIGDVNLRGMGSEQVAAVLRQAGTRVRLVVARPVDASMAAGIEGLAAPVVPTRILADADQIERHLAMFSNNNNNNNNTSIDDTSATTTGTTVVAVASPPPSLGSAGGGGKPQASSLTDHHTATAAAAAVVIEQAAPAQLGSAARTTTTSMVSNDDSGSGGGGGGIAIDGLAATPTLAAAFHAGGGVGIGPSVSAAVTAGGGQSGGSGGAGGLGSSLGTTLQGGPESGTAAAAVALSLSGHSPFSQQQQQNSSQHSSGGKLNQEVENVVVSQDMHAELLSLMGLDQLQLPEMETFEVELVKDQQGLGITIAGYVCEKGKDEEISGVFVKSVAKGSAADLNGRIRVNDQVIEVDGRPLQGYTNHQAVELLRSTGKVVRLRLARYLRGARYDQLQQAIMAESGGTQHGGSVGQQHHVHQVSSQQGVSSAAAAAAAAAAILSPAPLSQQATSIVTTVPPTALPLTTLSSGGGGSSSISNKNSNIILSNVNSSNNNNNVNINTIISSSSNNGCTTLPANSTTISAATNAAVNLLSNTGAVAGGCYAPNSSIALANLDNLIHGTLHHQQQHHVSGESALSSIGNNNSSSANIGSNDTAIARSAPGASDSSTHESEQEKIAKWTAFFGSDEYEIVIAQLCKFHEGGGLGISLEGTVDVNEAGEELRPHHYIRSVLPDGPVGLNGVLRSGDELVEVNGRQLLGLDHRDVVMTLKDLPLNVEMVCARAKNPPPLATTASSSPSPGPGAAGLHGTQGHHQASKAKSDTSLNRYSSEDEESGAGGPLGYSGVGGYAGVGGSSGGGGGGGGGGVGGASNKLNKLRSRSLEPLSGLAMWSNEPQLIELHKAERGLGFSILDYQDPMNPNETVIVIRSLVPGGVAQHDGRLIPGDRLLFVNDVNLENASLDAAVQALKGAAKGPVRIGVAKPLPLPCPHDNNNGAGGGAASTGIGGTGPGQLAAGDTGTLAALVKSESF